MSDHVTTFAQGGRAGGFMEDGRRVEMCSVWPWSQRREDNP